MGLMTIRFRNRSNKTRCVFVSDLIIWDIEGPAEDFHAQTLLWQSYESHISTDTISIPELLEQQADKYKNTYLKWIHNLGDSKCKGIPIKKILNIRKGFSYWWSTPLVEKCNYGKSPWIADAIKLLVFKDWAEGRDISKIRLVGKNRALAECIRSWCEEHGILFDFSYRSESYTKSIASWGAAIPRSLKAVAWLAKVYLERWPLKGVGLSAWRDTSGDLCFVSYLFHLSENSTQAYKCAYWGTLPEQLSRNQIKTNWLHIYHPNPSIPDASMAAQMINGFNSQEAETQVHASIWSFMGFGVVIKTFRDWVLLRWKSRNVHHAIKSIRLDGFDVWPLHAREWNETICGTTALSSLLYFNLFEVALKLLPRQKQAIYLQENQNWEPCLLSHWRNAGHGTITGCIHSNISYWDLRYFYYPSSDHHENVIMPDRIAVNSTMAYQALKGNGYPENQLIQTEALRYQYLEDLDASQECAHSRRKHLLVLSDYKEMHAHAQMSLLDAASAYLPADIKITVKPHPNFPIDPEKYPNLKFELSNEHISKLLPLSGIAFTSAVTTAAIDAYSAGLKVISMVDGLGLNQSPLRGYKDVRFVSSVEGLVESVLEDYSEENQTITARSFFYTDRGLCRWRKLLLS